MFLHLLARKSIPFLSLHLIKKKYQSASLSPLHSCVVSRIKEITFQLTNIINIRQRITFPFCMTTCPRTRDLSVCVGVDQDLGKGHKAYDQCRKVRGKEIITRTEFTVKYCTTVSIISYPKECCHFLTMSLIILVNISRHI